MDQAPIQTQERQALDALETLWMFLMAVAGIEDEYERARLTATSIPSLLPCCVSGMALQPEMGAGYTLVLQREGQQLSAVDTEPLLTELRPLFEAAMAGGPMLMTGADGTEGELFPRSLVSVGVQSLAVMPMRTLYHQIGMLLVGKSHGKGFTRQEEFILQMLAEHSAVAIENTRLQQALQRSVQDLQGRVEARTAQLQHAEARQRVLLEINNAVIANLERTPLFHAITQALRRLLAFDRATLTLYDPGPDVLRVFALEGPFLPRQFGGIGTEVSRQGSHVGWVLEHKAPLLRRDLVRERQFPVEQRLLTEGIRSYVIVPLMTKDRAFGTLNVGSLTPHQYADDDVVFLLEVAKQVALAVENMLAYEEIAQLKTQLEHESLYLQEEIKTEHNFEEIVGQSPAMQKVLQAVETVAPTDASVLILGETGTGKELVARALHHLSPRHAKPLVKVNCAALPAGLIESELFGHERGAFTGALSRRLGRFELAHGGTIFLDEIGELPLELQVKLLRVLQEGEFERLGGTHTFRVDVRVIAATNRNLTKAMQEGVFRQDLFYRLHVFPIPLPPLRERPEDIPLFVKYFAMKYCKSFGKRIETIPHKTMAALQTYPWPGNVRELEHAIERAVIISQGAQLTLGDWLPQPAAIPHDGRLATLQEVEREHIIRVLELTHWVVSGERGAAKLLGMKPTTLEARLKKLGIQRPR